MLIYYTCGSRGSAYKLCQFTIKLPIYINFITLLDTRASYVQCAVIFVRRILNETSTKFDIILKLATPYWYAVGKRQLLYPKDDN